MEEVAKDRVFTASLAFHDLIKSHLVGALAPPEVGKV